jgi:hypothetical protein
VRAPGRGPLTLADIRDLRAYEREREAFKVSVIELKRLRRVPIGPIVTVVFENRDTVRWQVQEMARAERMATDEQVQAELDAYNPLVPGPGELSLTLFIELTSEDALRQWLPSLVGIERTVELRFPPVPGDPAIEPALAQVDAEHAARLTREEVTASVHYVTIRLNGPQQERLAGGPASIAVAHPSYAHETPLSEATRASLVADWGH